MTSQDTSHWKEAIINDEMEAIMANTTWKLVDLPLRSWDKTHRQNS